MGWTVGKTGQSRDYLFFCCCQESKILNNLLDLQSRIWWGVSEAFNMPKWRSFLWTKAEGLRHFPSPTNKSLTSLSNRLGSNNKQLKSASEKTERKEKKSGNTWNGEYWNMNKTGNTAHRTVTKYKSIHLYVSSSFHRSLHLHSYIHLLPNIFLYPSICIPPFIHLYPSIVHFATPLN